MRPADFATDELTDAAQRARRGDQQALEQLAGACYGDVRRLCATLVDADVADDLAQETLVRIVRAVGSYRGESSARTWALAICRRVCMDELRRRTREARRQRALVEAAPWSATAESSPSIEVRELLSELEPERRAAFALTQLLRLSYEDAAAVCGCPTGTIRSRVARGREDLVRLLQSQEGAAPKGGALSS